MKIATKLLLGFAVLFIVAGALGGDESNSSYSVPSTTNASTPVYKSTEKSINSGAQLNAQPNSYDSQQYCPNGTYVNTYGNTVCRPYESSTVPAGATAKCRDGTYSFSQSRRGTCSSHGGVATWL